MRTILLATLALCALPLAAMASPVFVDSFNSNQVDPIQWTIEQSGGPTVQATNSRLEFTIPGNSTGSTFSADLRTNFTMVGDFDVQVDYSELTWPAHNGVRIGLTAAGGGIERVSRRTGEYDGLEDYSTDIAGHTTYITTTNTSGTLRLVRTGTNLLGYELGTGGWQLVGSGTCTASDVTIGFGGWSESSVFADQNVRFAMDNFQINSGTPEPATLSLLALGAVAILRRRRPCPGL